MWSRSRVKASDVRLCFDSGSFPKLVPLKRKWIEPSLRSLVVRVFDEYQCYHRRQHMAVSPLPYYTRKSNNYEYIISTCPRKKHFIQKFVEKLRVFAKAVMDAIVVALRSTEIAFRFSPLVLLTPAAMLTYTDKSHRISDLSWNYALYQIQSLGPAFVKLIQWAATRRDLFPHYVCNRLSELHDSTFLHSWKHTHQILCQVFGERYEEVLSLNQKNTIIGSGSIAQVYRAKLKRDGIEQDVAVKVLHPSIQRKINRDLSLMLRIASLAHLIPSDMIRMVNLPKATANFADVMRRQLDLQIEGENLTTFHLHFKDFRHIGFPKPIVADTNVLIESYEGNLPITKFLADESDEGIAHRRKLAGPLLRAFLKMMFIDNFVHCDLHPGNVLVQTTSYPNDEYKIVFLDAGIVTKLKDRDLQNLKDLFKAVILNDGETAGRLMVERAAYERCSQVEGGVDAFAKGVGEIVSDFHDRRRLGLTLGVVRIGSLLARVLDLCRIHGVEIDPAMSNVVMSTLVLEGLGRSLDPDSNLMDIALPFILGRAE